MATTMTARTGEFLLSEAPGTLSRESVVIVASSGDLVPGTVLGVITASGKYAPYDDDNTDGTQTAVGLLWAAAPDSAADQDAVIITRLAEVSSTKLVWASTNDATDKTNGLADLAARLIIARS